MLRCCAGICGGSEPTASARSSAPPAPERRPVVKPAVRLDEDEENGPPSFEHLIERFGMLAAPPGSDPPPPAVVSADFPRNVLRLLVLVPSSGSLAGAWNGHDSAARTLSWAEANGYATALFRAEALEAAPSELWDRVLRGSPAGCVTILVASGMLPVVQAALLPVHPLLLSRFRAICAVPADSTGAGCAEPDLAQQLLAGLPPGHEELRSQLRSTLVRIPAPADGEPRTWHQRLFELLQEREDRFQKTEAKKYVGFQNLKENDIPGFKRLPMDKRIERLDRDRGNDELACLLRKHERRADAGADDSEEEPGVD
mmetsp:Transcript_120371/g.374799  ORF Transcript_120371/g.374799 Transcript_120371/m.374799 type:complete len:314 (+) Transcript_120371:51-992(+)